MTGFEKILMELDSTVIAKRVRSSFHDDNFDVRTSNFQHGGKMELSRAIVRTAKREVRLLSGSAGFGRSQEH